MRIYHNSWNQDYREPFGAAPVGSIVRLAVDVFDAPGVRVFLRVWRDGYGESVVEMKADKHMKGERTRYSIKLELPDKPDLIWYYFVVEYGTSFIFYGNNHDKVGGEGKEYQIRPLPYQITVYKPTKTPDWYKNSICYQIFPDRFARDENWMSRAEGAINMRNRRIGTKENPEIQKQFIEEDWNKPAYYVKDENGNVTEWPFYCGSLKGIESKLNYLKSLGVSSIYLNPIFEAVSNHRYDTADYMRIDPILGKESDFRDLCSSAEKLGISIILDGVFSHTGADSLYFDKFGNYNSRGAYLDEDSKYRSWYKFDEAEECGYKSWWGVKDLPEVNEDNAFFTKMITGESGVIRKWLRAGAKGFRLDVADELPDSFIKSIRRSMKDLSEDNVLIGEVWEDASNKVSYDTNRQFLLGEELDASMNYPIRQILLDYINYTITSGEAAGRLMSLKENYPPECFYGALNLIGTHDRARILTELAGYEDYSSGCNKVKIMSALQYTLPGVPCIYYGDEVGMMGDTDPDNRSAFPWDGDRQNKDLAYHYRMLGLIYNQHQALKDGDFELMSGQFDSIPDDVLAFLRYDDKEQILVLANRSYGSTFVDMAEFGLSPECCAIDLLSSKEMDLSGLIELESLSAKIILIKDNKPIIKNKERRAGIICHISSLPGGTLGKPARDFVDWLAEIGIKVWQILPLNPCGEGNCPYNTYSAFAGNNAFINRNELPYEMSGLRAFCDKNSFWLNDYVQYVIDTEIKADSKNANRKIDEWKSRLINDQYYFYVQWKDLKDYANSKGIQLMGDLPMYVGANSSDFEFNKELFQVDGEGNLSAHAGVPADYFNPDGQDWGMPLYNWVEMENDGYKWWINRFKQCAERYDIVRIDHFRGFSEYFMVPNGETPKEGIWMPGPGEALFEKVNEALDSAGLDLEIIAEDLGQLDNGVINLLKMTGYSGMNVWQFNSDEIENMPKHIAQNRVFYTGTHDNQTLLGWLKSKYEGSLDDDKLLKVQALDVMHTLLKSDANMVVLQLQDLLLLDDHARMNIPGNPEGNWKWNITQEEGREGYNDMVLQMSKWLYNEIIQSGRYNNRTLG